MYRILRIDAAERFRYGRARLQDPDAGGSDSAYVSNVYGDTKWLNYVVWGRVAMTSLMAENGVIFLSINDIKLGRLLMPWMKSLKKRTALTSLRGGGSADNKPSPIQIEHEYLIVAPRTRTPSEGAMPADAHRGSD